MLATIEKIAEVQKHPNADALDIVKVLGYDCIVRRDSQKEGDEVVFIQPDTVLPVDRPWAADLLKYTSRGRVKAARLRGAWSMGIILPASVLQEVAPGYRVLEVGDDVSGLLGVVKYEPPAPKNLAAKGGLPFGIPKTDEPRWQSLRDVPWGAPVDVTLKIDGSSFTAYCALPGVHPGEEPVLGVCSRSLELKLDESEGTNAWLEAARLTNVLDRLRAYCVEQGVSLALRGEVYGPGVQVTGCNPHCRRPRGVAFFSVWNIQERRYEGRCDAHYFERVCEALDLPAVPILERSVPLTEELVRYYGDDLDAFGGEMFEGVVLKGDDFSLKVVNKAYDAKK